MDIYSQECMKKHYNEYILLRCQCVDLYNTQQWPSGYNELQCDFTNASIGIIVHVWLKCEKYKHGPFCVLKTSM